MRKTPADHARMLRRKAADDLHAARLIVASGAGLDTAGFHAQQAVEKSLKAILAIHDRDYPRSHDILELIELAKPLVDEWPFEDSRLALLNRFAVDVRYHDEYPIATLDEAHKALETAESVYHRVGTMIGLDPKTPDESTEV
jgi:HEPN domain-containing protein